MRSGLSASRRARRSSGGSIILEASFSARNPNRKNRMFRPYSDHFVGFHTRRRYTRSKEPPLSVVFDVVLRSGFFGFRWNSLETTHATLFPLAVDSLVELDDFIFGDLLTAQRASRFQ